MNDAFGKEAEEMTYALRPAQLMSLRRIKKKLYLGHEQREGWSGKLPFYLFWCDKCQHYAKDYPHGHIERQYLLCSHCGAHHSFVPWWAGLATWWQHVRYTLITSPRKRG